MNARPSSPKPAPTMAYGHDAPPDSSGTIRPAPKLTASAVNPLRHHARYVRSFASRVRRVASWTPGSCTRSPSATSQAALLVGSFHAAPDRDDRVVRRSLD